MNYPFDQGMTIINNKETSQGEWWITPVAKGWMNK